MGQPPGLRPVEEDWQRMLAVVAHPDDLEYGAASAVARWTRQGKRVAYCLVTRGEAGIDALPPERVGPIREREQRSAAAVVGVETVEFLGLPDGVLEYGVALRREIAGAIRRHRPDVVLTNNFQPFWDEGTTLNQADHIAVGRATLDAARDAGNRWVFADLTGEGLDPWTGVRQVWADGSPAARHGVDVSDTYQLGQASLREHASYLNGLGQPVEQTIGFLDSFARANGTQLGCERAIRVEVFTV